VTQDTTVRSTGTEGDLSTEIVASVPHRKQGVATRKFVSVFVLI